MITKDEKYYKFNDNFFFSIFGSIDQYEINFLLLTSIFVAFYVGINAIIATKVHIYNLPLPSPCPRTPPCPYPPSP